MHIDNYKDAMMACRFCFMCRHLSAIGNVTFTEADTPRIRAAMMYGITTGTNSLSDEDFIATLYRQDLSACCRYHCVNHFDETGLALAARADVVAAGLAPENVKALAEELKLTAKWKLTGSSDVVFFEDVATAAAKTVAPAFAKIAKAAKLNYGTIKGGCIGKALKVLGFLDDAKAVAQEFATFLKENGVKTIVCPNPAAFDALTKDYPEMGIKLPCKVYCTAGFLNTLKVSFKKAAGEIYYLPSDFMRNYDECDCPEKLLKTLKAALKQFGTNNEETYCCGEGAVVLDRLHPELVDKLAKYVEERADDVKKDTIVVSSPYTKRVLSVATSLKVKTVEELAASCL